MNANLNVVSLTALLIISSWLCTVSSSIWSWNSASFLIHPLCNPNAKYRKQQIWAFNSKNSWISKQRQLHFQIFFPYLWTDTQPSTAFPTYWERKTSCYFTARARLFLWAGSFLQQCCLHINVSCWWFFVMGDYQRKQGEESNQCKQWREKVCLPPSLSNVSE